MVVIDATLLLLMLRPETPVPNSLAIDRPKERIDFLVKQLGSGPIKFLADQFAV
ncbi:MAG: hypothetical protein RIQ75_1749 [Pseudomonadota bacterium]|jgi:hypothetical protein